jgi:tetratricopeptide (TPR) repeat protein
VSDSPVIVLNGMVGNHHRIAIINGKGDSISLGRYQNWDDPYGNRASRYAVLRKDQSYVVLDLTSGKPVGAEFNVAEAPGNAASQVEVDVDSTANTVVVVEGQRKVSFRRVSPTMPVIGRFDSDRVIQLIHLAPGGDSCIFVSPYFIRLWRRDKELLNGWSTPGYAYSALQYSADGKHAIVTRFGQGKAIIQTIDARAGIMNLTKEVGTDQWPPTLAVSQNMAVIESMGTESGNVLLWNLDKSQAAFAGENLIATSGRSKISPKGSFLGVWSQNLEFRVLATGKRLGPPVQTYGNILGISPHDNLIAVRLFGSGIRLWSPHMGKYVGAELRLNAAPVAVRFSDDESLVAVSSLDGYLRLWSVSSGEAVTPPIQFDALSSFEFLANGRGIVISSRSGTSLYSLAEYDRPLSTLSAWLDSVSLSGAARLDSHRWEEIRRLFPKEVAFRDISANRLSTAEAKSDNESELDRARRDPELSLDDKDSWFELALQSAKVSRWEDVIAAAKGAISRGKEGAAPWYLKGVAEMQLRRYDDAKVSFESARRESPNSSYPNVDVAALFELRDYLGMALKLESTNVLGAFPSVGNSTLTYQEYLCYVLGESEDNVRRLAQRFAAQAVKSSNPDTIVLYSERCVLSGDSLEDYSRIIAALQSVPSRFQDHELFSALGMSLYRAKRFDDAIQTLMKGIEVSDGLATPTDNLFLAESRYRLGDIAGAEDALNKAIPAYDAIVKANSTVSNELLEAMVLRKEASALQSLMGRLSR